MTSKRQMDQLADEIKKVVREGIAVQVRTNISGRFSDLSLEDANVLVTDPDTGVVYTFKDPSDPWRAKLVHLFKR